MVCGKRASSSSPVPRIAFVVNPTSPEEPPGVWCTAMSQSEADRKTNHNATIFEVPGIEIQQSTEHVPEIAVDKISTNKKIQQTRSCAGLVLATKTIVTHVGDRKKNSE